MPILSLKTGAPKQLLCLKDTIFFSFGVARGKNRWPKMGASGRCDAVGPERRSRP